MQFSLIHYYPLILVQNDANTTYAIKFQRFLNKIKYRYQIVPISKVEGYYVFQYNKMDISIGSNLFQCTKGGYILSENVCDGITDCPNDKSDEEFTILQGHYLQNDALNLYSNQSKRFVPIITT